MVEWLYMVEMQLRIPAQSLASDRLMTQSLASNILNLAHSPSVEFQAQCNHMASVCWNTFFVTGHEQLYVHSAIAGIVVFRSFCLCYEKKTKKFIPLHTATLF